MNRDDISEESIEAVKGLSCDAMNNRPIIECCPQYAWSNCPYIDYGPVSFKDWLVLHILWPIGFDHMSVHEGCSHVRGQKP